MKEQPGSDILHASAPQQPHTPPLAPPSVLQLLHPVEGRPCLEPFDLCLVEAVIEFQRLLTAVTVLQNCMKRLNRSRRGCNSTQH